MSAIIAQKLPLNLRKLFAPRQPPDFFKPLGKNPNEPGPNKLDGVAPVLNRIREEEEEKLLKQEETSEQARDGKDGPKFTLAFEWEKQLRREKRKKQKEEYKKNLEKTCE